MPASVAAVVFAAGILFLFHLDRDRDARTSPALWLPVVWIFIGASRMASQWFGGVPAGPLDTDAVYMDGSPVDRLFLSGLLVAALVVVIARTEESGRWLRANGPLVVFFLYCAVSVLWSDYTFVAFKRWTKALGNITMVLVVLTDPDVSSAVKRVLARTGFLLIPLSVLYIKYYPALGRGYNRWTWMPLNIGVSTDKNGLGALCMIFGLASLWRLLELARDRALPDRMRHAGAHAAILAMALWLCIKADSSTALACFMLGAALLVLIERPAHQRPVNVNVIAAAVVLIPLLLGLLFQGVFTYAIEGLGRNTTLTGRTDIWRDLFRMDLNRWLGTGFESFWLGPRAEFFWNKYYFHPNQAHNGYIETYINLGAIGVALLALIAVSGYLNIVQLYRRDPVAGSLRLAMFLIALVYSITEAAFKVMNPVWIVFLLAVAAVPALPVRQPKRNPATLKVPFVGPRPSIDTDATAALPIT